MRPSAGKPNDAAVGTLPGAGGPSSSGALDVQVASGTPPWAVIVAFLRETDAPLLFRLARRLLNDLCWNGVEDAQRLLGRLAATVHATGAAEGGPSRRDDAEAASAIADEIFAIGAAHLSDAEMRRFMRRWIKEDQASFLMEAVENQGTSLPAMAAALERYQHLHLDDRDLSRTRQAALRAALVRRFLTDDVTFVETAKRYVGAGDFHALVQHIISPAEGHGKLGGKSAGLFLAAQILGRAEHAHLVGDIKCPRTWYLASDTLLDFIAFNHLEDVYDRKYLDIDQVRRGYPHTVQMFRGSVFPPETVRGLALALDDFEDHSLIVRSSSLLEDRVGASFSGMYRSVFLANQGSREARLRALMDGVAEVWASIFGPDPIQYRAEKGLLDVHEEMGVMIQEVVGSRMGRYFLPSYAGVAFSRNDYRWSPRLTREDGLVRLVPGIGTRAVERLGDDYPVLLSPGRPGLRVNVTPEDIVRYAPRKVDLINLETGQFETRPVREVVEEVGPSYPAIAHVVSLWDGHHLHTPLPGAWDAPAHDLVVTFDGLIERTSFVRQVRAMLRILQDSLGHPVDIEFASDGQDLYLLQCRAQSWAADASPAAIPDEIPPDRLLFRAERHVSNGKVPDLTHLVYVDPDRYHTLGTLEQLEAVARAVGRLNRLLPRRGFGLLGPGRWGSRGDVRLGVPVSYADISNAALLVEIATRHGRYLPEVSFGTHFFQDLVESDIRYLPLYPDDGGALNRVFLQSAPNALAALLPEFASLEDVVRVIDVRSVTGGHVVRVLMNGDVDRAVAFLSPPEEAARPGTPRRRAPSADDHAGWRARMAARLAARLDAARFGVRALFLCGSAVSGTAGPSSDLDLLVHFAGTPAQRSELLQWLEGWSLALAEMNFQRTGRHTDGLIDVRFLTDADMERRAADAETIEETRLLPMGACAAAGEAQQRRS
jgi:hypothetical protein